MSEPHCNHDAAAVRDGRCECGAFILPCYGIVVELGDEREDTPGAYTSGSITSDLHEPTPPLGRCILGAPGENPDDCTTHAHESDDVQYDAAIDGLESMILAHACAGIDIASNAYVEGIETAVDAIIDNLT